MPKADISAVFMLQTVSYLTHVTLMVVNKAGDALYSLSGWKDETNALVQDADLRAQLIAAVKSNPICMYQDLPGIYFGAVCWFDDTYVILGPFTESDIGPALVKAFAYKHGTKLRPINRCLRYVITAALGLLYHLCTGKEISLSELGDSVVEIEDLDRAANAQIMKVMLRQYESVVPHNDGSWEIIRRKCIMSGDLEGLQRHRDAPFSGKRGVIGPNKLRNAKNLAIVDVTVSSRAALDAGIDSETVYTISDGYYLQIEQVQSEAEADALAHIAAVEFTKLVKDLKEGPFTLRAEVSPFFIAARDFIIRNLQSRLTLAYIAANVGCSADYLQELFKKELKCSVMDFVAARKIEQSITLMRDKKLTLAAIALMLGYSSMSNFIAQFKKRKHMTPGKFRRQLLNNYVLPVELPEVDPARS